MLYYLGYYVDKKHQNQRKAYLSAVNKMQYVASVIKRISPSVQIVSCSMADTTTHMRSEDIEVDNGIGVHYFFSFGRKSKVSKALDYVIFPLQLIFYILKKVRKEDVLLAYHATSYCYLLSFLKKIKGFRLILEVEEIYSDVNLDSTLRKKEEYVIRAADAYIFPTDLLNQKLNKSEKPYVVVHGTYGVEYDRESRTGSNKIHVVYAGTLDPRKGGAAAAAAAAKFLPENYHIHILGFGSNEQIENIKSIIEHNSDKKTAEVSYDGLLYGEEYINFLQSCDIGLSTQNPDAAFNGTSFPSKILSYMANGLRVVSINIESVRESEVGDLITYYDKQLPENIAKAIESVDMSFPYDSRQRLIELNRKFQKEMGKLIEDISHES